MSTKKIYNKREYILEKSKDIFTKKGFTSVTMTDIIDVCNISRGGLYLYFSSVDEIFIEMILSINAQKLNEAKTSVTEDKTFTELIDIYFEKQKNRILNIDSSLLMAMHQYRFSHKNDSDVMFFSEQFLNTKMILLELLNYGIHTNEIRIENTEDLAVHIMLFIEGLSTLAATSTPSEEFIDNQIEFIKKLIFTKNRNVGVL